MKIEIDKKSVFTFNAETLSVQLHNHRDGKYDGPMIGQIGEITFSDIDQVFQFQEMLQLIIDKKSEVI